MTTKTTRAVVWRIENETGWSAYSREEDALKMHALEGGVLTPLVPEAALEAAEQAIADERARVLLLMNALATCRGAVHANMRVCAPHGPRTKETHDMILDAAETVFCLTHGKDCPTPRVGPGESTPDWIAVCPHLELAGQGETEGAAKASLASVLANHFWAVTAATRLTPEEALWVGLLLDELADSVLTDENIATDLKARAFPAHVIAEYLRQRRMLPPENGLVR